MLDVKNIGPRGLLFMYDELAKSEYNCITNIFVIIGRLKYFICDTYLGSSYMQEIKAYLEKRYGVKEYLIFNSHSHWDHIWGNSEFKDNIILSHKNCRELIQEHGEQELLDHFKDFAREEIEIVLPNLTFTDSIIFESEGIEFFYTPGHSVDSASCYDHKSKLLFVADNVDDPVPTYMDWDNLWIYRETLRDYLNRDLDYIVQSHGDELTIDIVKQNIEYLSKRINKTSV